MKGISAARVLNLDEFGNSVYTSCQGITAIKRSDCLSFPNVNTCLFIATGQEPWQRSDRCAICAVIEPYSVTLQ